MGRRLFATAGLLSVAGCAPVDILNAASADRLRADGIAYGPDPRQKLDLYRPVGPGPFPVLVFLYGGSWQEGERAKYRFLGASFAARGFLVAIPDYRLFPAVRFPAFVEDCALAVSWCRRYAARYGGDGAPLFLMGHSAGAFNAAMLALAPGFLGAVGLSPRNDLAGTIGLAGPYDFLPLTDPTLKTVFGAGPDGIAAPETQPIHFVDGRNGPMLLLAGTSDITVKPGNTERLAARIRARGGPVVARLYPGVEHLRIIGALSPILRFMAPTMRDCLRFMGDPSRA